MQAFRIVELVATTGLEGCGVSSRADSVEGASRLKKSRGSVSKPPNRKSIRLKGYDYAGPGSLFFTYCTVDRQDYFGAIATDAMCENELGRIVWDEWRRTVEMRQEMRAHAFIVMPNHVHGLISMIPSLLFVPMKERADCNLPLHARKRPHSLSTISTGFKGAVTRGIRRHFGDPHLKVWQRNYFERVVRDNQEFETVLQYIQTNPKKWAEDRFNPDNPT